MDIDKINKGHKQSQLRTSINLIKDTNKINKGHRQSHKGHRQNQ
jgi:hypothetical protein